MSEAVKTKKQKKSWFKGLKAEFSKIIWPDQKSLTKETIAVLVVSVLLGVIISVVDLIVRFGIEFIVSKEKVIRWTKQNGMWLIRILAMRIM